MSGHSWVWIGVTVGQWCENCGLLKTTLDADTESYIYLVPGRLRDPLYQEPVCQVAERLFAVDENLVLDLEHVDFVHHESVYMANGRFVQAPDVGALKAAWRRWTSR